ncbi:DUF1150 family protein [Psychromarinibacter halotolerans]|uniref:DUF1150 family protein n=1 Tax=Psychromarinibacter halotolerans TaxID=1775175 RepID=A0ABV7GL22_9RHOB|nr:DUF1150 family protein [Psychromarinibacter halotolerans]MAQ84055.1 hypothetical protein [Maritimibacter sp.]MDF0597841.1 DUF1150 family protein [Psychromarinibacter halotolerans]
MNTTYDFAADVPQDIVYVRSVDVADLPEDVQAEVEGLDQIFAVHNTEGERLALVRDRSMAFALARQNDLAPVSVH